MSRRWTCCERPRSSRCRALHARVVTSTIMPMTSFQKLHDMASYLEDQFNFSAHYMRYKISEDMIKVYIHT